MYHFVQSIENILLKKKKKNEKLMFGNKKILIQ